MQRLAKKSFCRVRKSHIDVLLTGVHSEETAYGINVKTKTTTDVTPIRGTLQH